MIEIERRQHRVQGEDLMSMRAVKPKPGARSRRIPRSVHALVLSVLSLGPIGSAAQAQQSPLELETKIPLGTVKGRIDHLAVDLLRKHLFVAELENNSVSIVDLNNGSILHRISGLEEPQGVGYVPTLDTLVVANGGDGSVRLFRGENFAATATMQLGKDADNVRVDVNSKSVYVGYGAGALAVIDPSSHAKIKDIVLPAHPESFQISQDTQKVFVNLPDARSIAVIDTQAGRLSQNWPTGNDHGNFAMTLDEGGRRAIVVFRNPPKLSVRDLQTGTPVAERNTCGDVDDVFFDSKRQRIYVTCGEGAIDVFDARADYAPMARIATQRGARTSLFMAPLDRLALAVRAGEAEPAAIWVYRPLP
jgi:DNA-binding beta-propeller fold protein YncE